MTQEQKEILLATEYAKYYSIKAQRKDESDYSFQHRVAGALRDMGKIIEAHEAQQNERIETSENVMTGMMGAVAQALQGIDYGVSGVQQVGCDIVAGEIVRHPKPEIPAAAVLLAVLLNQSGGR